MGVAALRLEEYLMPFLLGKAHHLVLDGGAIAGSHSLNHPTIHGRLIEVIPDNIVGLGVGVGDPAGQLFHVELLISPGVEGEDVVGLAGQAVGHEAEFGHDLIPVLALTPGKIE